MRSYGAWRRLSDGRAGNRAKAESLSRRNKLEGMKRPPLLGSTSYLLVQVAKAHRGIVGQGLSELGLHVGQELVLAQLWREDGLRQSHLAERLAVEPPTVTKVLKGMERAELITRERDKEDARAIRVRLSERGRALRGPVERLWRGAERTALRGLDRADRDLLHRVLRQMSLNLE